MTKRKQGKKRGRRWPWLAAVGFVAMLRFFVFSNYMVEGKSMMPTLQSGNLLIVNKIRYESAPIHRFDVVVFHANQKEDYVKRVIGLPGDRIEYKNDVLYINGR